jgi:hypothetical protein
MVVLNGCYKDDIDDLNDKYDKLSGEQQALQEEQQRQAELLKNYQALLNALNQKLTVTGFSETTEGYLITFSDGSTMEVKHGNVGQDGVDGTDGQSGIDGTNGQDGTSAPVITSIKQIGNQLVFFFSDGSTIRISMFPTDFSKGTFILNEGNMSNETGKLTYIDPYGVIYDSAYIKVNGSKLGNVCQDMFIYKDKMYIMSQNGKNDGRLVIADAKTLKKEQGFDAEISVTWPTHVAVTSYDNIYIRSNNGIHRFNPQTSTLTAISGSSGAAKNRMVVVNDKVFAFASSSILVLQDGNDAVIQTVDLGQTITGIIPSNDGKIWVSCSGSPSLIIRFDPDTYNIIDQHQISEISIGAGWGASPAISAKDDTLYFSNASFIIYRHVFSTNETTLMGDVRDWVAGVTVVYNNLAVHPTTGNVYFNSIKSYATYNTDSYISVFNFNKTEKLVNNYKGYTSFPAGIYFPENYN